MQHTAAQDKQMPYRMHKFCFFHFIKNPDNIVNCINIDEY